MDLSQSADAVQAVIRNSAGAKRSWNWAWLIGCDGAHSSVRHLLGSPFEGAAYPETFLLADVKIDDPLDHVTFHLFLAGEGLVGIFPFRGDRCRIIANHAEGSRTTNRSAIPSLRKSRPSSSVEPISEYVLRTLPGYRAFTFPIEKFRIFAVGAYSSQVIPLIFTALRVGRG